MIRAYVGLQGKGKTFSMVNDAIPALKAGKRVVSNTPIKVGEHESILREGKEFWDDFMTQENTLYVMDEGGILLGKYEWKNVALDLWWRILLHRKYGNHLFFGTPNFKDVSTQMRTYVEQAVACSPTKFPMIGYTNIYYQALFFEYNKEDLPTEFEKQFIIKRKFISTSRMKKVYSYYDTKYTVIPSTVEKVVLPQPSPEADEGVIGKYL